MCVIIQCKVVLQKTISPLYEAKGIRLDVYVQDSNRVFDIEIQNVLEENLPKRTRYYQSIMDMDLLSKGKNYSVELAEAHKKWHFKCAIKQSKVSEEGKILIITDIKKKKEKTNAKNFSRR